MKSKVNKELWLLNTGSADVSLSDLGIKVLAGKSVNVYSANPYLTEKQVDDSMKTGSLSKRLSGDQPVLKVIKKNVSDGKKIIGKIKQSDSPIKATRTRNSVVIDAPVQDEFVEDRGFDFADYGVDDSIVSSTVENGSVVVKVKEDSVDSTVSSPPQKMVQQDKVVVVESEKQPEAKKEIEELKVEAPEVEIKPKEVAPTQSVKAEVTDKKQSDFDFLDSLPVKKETQEDTGIRVASRTKGGITIMKIKE